MVWGDSDEYVWNSSADTFLLIHQLLPVVEELSKMQPHVNTLPPCVQNVTL